MNQKVTWVHVLIVVVFIAPFLWILNAVSKPSATDVAGKLITADKGKPNPQNKGIADYTDRIQQLQELTGSSPKEIGELTLKHHKRLTGDNAIGCFQFMSAIIIFTRSAAPQGEEHYKWEDYEEAAQAFVDFIQTGDLPG